MLSCQLKFLTLLIKKLYYTNFPDCLRLWLNEQTTNQPELRYYFEEEVQNELFELYLNENLNLVE